MGRARECASLRFSLLSGDDGTFAPFLKKNIGFAYVPVEYANPGQEINIDVRGRLVCAKIVKAPFYKRAK